MTNLFLEIIEINMLLISQVGEVATQTRSPYTPKHFVHGGNDSSITRFLAKV